MIAILAKLRTLIKRNIGTRDKPPVDRPMTEQERAEYWARIVGPATWNSIEELSRHHR